MCRALIEISSGTPHLGLQLRPMPDENDQDPSVSVRRGYALLVIGATAILIAIYLLVLVLSIYRGDVLNLPYQHAGTIFGVPSAVVVSLAVVLLLRTVAGNIQFKVLGMEFKGASGPIIMWILCFLALILAIVRTWSLPAK